MKTSAGAALAEYRQTLVAAGFALVRTESAFAELRRGAARVLVTARPVPEGDLLTVVVLEGEVGR
jgi:hypothetical protein